MRFLVLFDMRFGNIGDSRVFSENQPEMPPINTIGRLRVIRLPGELSSGECLGVGFLRKDRHDDRVHWHFPNYVLVLLLHGSGMYTDSHQKQYPLHSGSTFVRIPNLEHSNYVDVDSGYLECYLEIGPRLFQTLNAMNCLQPTHPPVHEIDLDNNPDIPRRIWHLGWLLTYLTDDRIDEAVSEMVSLLGEIRRISRNMHPGEKYRDLMELACSELSQNLAEPFSVQEFCKKHQVGYENFRKLFRARMGMSPWNYRIQCRMENAAMLLSHEKLTMKEIAEQFGYRSQYQFSAQFKQKYGISPSEYRKTH